MKEGEERGKRKKKKGRRPLRTRERRPFPLRFFRVSFFGVAKRKLFFFSGLAKVKGRSDREERERDPLAPWGMGCLAL